MFELFELRQLVALFVYCAIFRYCRLVVNAFAYYRLRPIPVPDSPQYSSRDVTIIIPTIDGDGEALRETLRTCLVNDPVGIILVTIDPHLDRARQLAASISGKIRVLSVARANKRRQMCRAIPEVTTAITVFADDDVVWPVKTLLWMLAPFEDAGIGGVGTNQCLRRAAVRNMWSFLNAEYLIRRNWDIAACTYMDGSLPCLSGRTVAYRTKILQDPEFTFGFTNETWRSNQLNADDDNFLTRWMVSHGWRTYVQFHRECEVQTTLEDNGKYLWQCLRWSRSNWRSNYTSMFVERTIWRRHPWTAYATFQTTLTNWPVVFDPLMLSLLTHITAPLGPRPKWALRGAWLAWQYGVTRALKSAEHFCRYPEDLIYFPCLVLFGQLHCFIKLWALCTLNETAWGSREGADADNSDRMIPLASADAMAENKKTAELFLDTGGRARKRLLDEKTPAHVCHA